MSREFVYRIVKRITAIGFYGLALGTFVCAQELSFPPGTVAPPIAETDHAKTSISPGQIEMIPVVGQPVDEPSLRWWEAYVDKPILASPQWVSFELPTVVVETLRHNPRIAAVTHQSAIAVEQIVQADAIFDPAVLLSSLAGSTSDPVGNSLTTGGPPRLIQDSFANQAGIIKTNRDGTQIDLSQQMGLLNSNSQFFLPGNQGNSRLNLSIVRPLRAGAGQLYNERLVLQARIDSKFTMQQMREDVQDRIATTMVLYWRIYQARCQLIQSRSLLQRGLEIEKIVQSRRNFDSGELEISKVNTRITRRRDALVEKERELRNLQTQLAAIVSSEQLRTETDLELIPLGTPTVQDVDFMVKDLVINALNNRPDVRTAALDMEAASLKIAITRNELLPKLNAIAGGYVVGLQGQNDVIGSFGDQFSTGRPGVNAGLEYEMPYGRRASRSRNRAAHQLFAEKSERYRERVAQTASEVEIAARNVTTSVTSMKTKQRVLEAASRQEFLVRMRWETLGSDGRHASLVLEDLLEQQEAHTAAQQDVVAAEVGYLLSLIQLQESMGTLLMTEGIESTPVSRTRVQWEPTRMIEDYQDAVIENQAIEPPATMIESDIQ